MGQPELTVGFGDYLRDAIHAAGYATPTQFARAVNTDPSVVLRWLSEDQRPTIRSLERVAPKLGKTVSEMVGAAYPDRIGLTAPIVGRAMHELGYEIGRMLAADSPISPTERQALAAVLNRIVDPYRKDMRRRRPLDDAHSLAEATADDAAPHETAEPATPPATAPAPVAARVPAPAPAPSTPAVLLPRLV